MSQAVQQVVLTRLLVEKGILTKEEFLEKVKRFSTIIADNDYQMKSCIMVEIRQSATSGRILSVCRVKAWGDVEKAPG